MAMRVFAAGPVAADGGTIFVAEGCSPNGLVTWAVTAGGGTITALSSTANSAGVASAKYSATAGTPATQGQTVTVLATSYA